MDTETEQRQAKIKIEIGIYRKQMHMIQNQIKDTTDKTIIAKLQSQIADIQAKINEIQTIIVDGKPVVINQRYRKPREDVIDYETEFANGTRCPSCKRKTTPVVDYAGIGKNSGNTCKTCVKCRTAVLESNKRKPRVVKKALTLKEKVEMYEKIIKDVDINVIENLIRVHRIKNMPEELLQERVHGPYGPKYIMTAEETDEYHAEMTERIRKLKEEAHKHRFDDPDYYLKHRKLFDYDITDPSNANDCSYSLGENTEL